ncbi:MAG: CDP-diacylglycerol--serine O-phosphatidyltransferase [Bacteroidales bacterium]|nr:CDP-diacylglycerol--serine O-phosphatidyltransferase [Bacteroidales bacterium]
MGKSKKLTRFIPNFITSLNLFSGSIASVLAFEGYLTYAAAFIVLASIFDFFDGMSARLLKVSSPMGKELDSLSDLVSFGFAPSVILYSLLKQIVFPNIQMDLSNIQFSQILILLSPFLIAVFSGLRLAKFNVDERQTSSFIGLPTPANALLIVSLPIILSCSNYDYMHSLILNVYVLIPLIFIQSYLLVAEFPMFSFKFKNLKFNDNKIRYIFLISTIVLFVIFKFAAIPLTIFTYIIFSAVNNWIIPKNK